MISKLDGVVGDFERALAETRSAADLANVKAQFLGKKGVLAAIMGTLGKLTPEERRTVGARCNECKELMSLKFQEREDVLKAQALEAHAQKDWIDCSLREINIDRGLATSAYHPTFIVQREIEEVFLSMGFEILDGPHIETEYYNFEALNVAKDHPARDMQDTFWFPDAKHLLRTHTSAVQAHGMETHRPPFQFIVPGTCFRCERTDASHEMVFGQLEGMMVDKDVSVANLVYFMQTLLEEIFRKKVKIRLRPGFFPFVEPGFELDIQCLICSGAGCSVCKQSGWVELLPCGMVHPRVLSYGKIDPEEFSGFAFGLGLDRLVMMRYQINDIRLLRSGDLRFISQFSSL